MKRSRVNGAGHHIKPAYRARATNLHFFTRVRTWRPIDPKDIEMETDQKVETNGAGTAAQARRTFLRQASAATLLTTVASQSVWAGQCSISGHLSGNLSNAVEVVCTLSGYSPGGWTNGHAANNDLWRYLDVGPDSFFFSHNGNYGPFAYAYTCNANSNGCPPETLTFAQALSGGGRGDGTGWERQAAAAYLNAGLWEELMLLCMGDPGGCSALEQIGDDFYYADYTRLLVIAAYNNRDSAAYRDWERAHG